MLKGSKLRNIFLICLITVLSGAFTLAAGQDSIGRVSVSAESHSLSSFAGMPLTNNRLIDNYFEEYSSHNKKKSSKGKSQQPLRDNFGLNYIAFSIGPSAPLGKYSQGAINQDTFLYAFNKTSLDVPPSALLGLQFSFDGAFYFDKHFGISAMAGYSFHQFDTTQIDGQIDYSPYNAQVTASTYNNLFFFVGPCVGTGNEDVFFEVRAMIGVYHSSAFNLDIKSSYDTTYNVEWKYTAPGYTQLGFLIGADLRYKINPFLAVMFKTDFIFSTQRYPTTVVGNENVNGVVYPPERISYLHQNGATQIAPSVGIVYILNTESPKPQNGQQGQPSKKGGNTYYYN